MSDKIIVSQIDCITSIGVSIEERSLKTVLSVDVEISTDTRPAARSDSLEDAIDYAAVVDLVVRLGACREYKLVETLAEEVARVVLADCGGTAVRVQIRKHPPPLEAPVGFVAIEIVRHRTSE